MKKILTLLGLLSLLFINVSCQKSDDKYVKIEVVSYNWDVLIYTAVNEHSRMLEMKEDGPYTRKKTITDTEILRKTSRMIQEDMVECTSLCQIDIRLAMLLYDSENDTKPDTLSFGNIFKAKFNDDYYMLNKELVKTILAEVDSEQLKLFEDYYRDYPND